MKAIRKNVQSVALRETLVESVPFEKFEVPYSVRLPNPDRPSDLKPYVMNDVAKEFEKQYSGLMDAVSRLMSPEEMRTAKRQAAQLKGKK